MSNLVYIIAILAGIAAGAWLCFWMGRRIQKGRQAAAVEEARQRMDKVGSGTLSSTAQRLRSRKF